MSLQAYDCSSTGKFSSVRSRQGDCSSRGMLRARRYRLSRLLWSSGGEAFARLPEKQPPELNSQILSWPTQ